MMQDSKAYNTDRRKKGSHFFMNYIQNVKYVQSIALKINK